MQNDISFYMQEEMKPRIKYRRQGKKSYLARRRRCVAGLAVSLAVLRWRPVAVSWLTDGGSKQRCCCSSGGEREISSSSPLLWFFRAERERFLPLPLSSSFFVFSFSVSFTRGYPFVLSVLF
jgi:hypothetical protein